MNYKFLATKIDKEFMREFKNENIQKRLPANTVVYKPWGYEYCMDEGCSHNIWILHVNRGESTSLHAHRNKDTFLFVLSGELQFGTFKGTFMIYPYDKIFIEKKVFHRMMSTTDNTIVMEIESSCNKFDSLRLTDAWKREHLPYDANCKIIRLGCE